MLSSRMLLVGLTGGLASGKSTVAGMFRSLGAYILDADQLARAVVEPGKPAFRDIVRTFGKGVLQPDGYLDRKALARKVFHDRRKLRALNAIVHPRVAREQQKITRSLTRLHPQALIIYDAPVLIEAKAHRRMDVIIVVTADRDTQIARLQSRNGFSKSEALRRIQSQLPFQKKLPLADYVIDGTLPRPTIRRQVRAIKLALDSRQKPTASRFSHRRHR